MLVEWYLGLFSPPLTGESFDTCSKAAKLILADTQVFLTWLTCFTVSGELGSTENDGEINI